MFVFPFAGCGVVLRGGGGGGGRWKEEKYIEGENGHELIVRGGRCKGKGRERRGWREWSGREGK